MSNTSTTSPKKRATILAVEDDAAIGRLLRNLLEPAGYQLVLAATGEAAWEYMNSNSVADLILLDLQLPDVDGEELVRRLGEGVTKLPPVLVISAKWHRNVQQAAQSINAAGIVYKPFDIEELLAQVELALAGRLPA